MKVLVAGATGAVGVPLVRALTAAGHHVTGISRSSAGTERLQSLGAGAVGADVLDRDALMAAVGGRTFDAVIHELTALKKAPARYRDMSATNELRERGTANLLEAAHTTGATRMLTQSIVFGYGYLDHGREPLTEASPFGQPHQDKFDPSIAAMASTENQLFTDPAVEGIALRYGLFYGGDIDTMVGMLRKRRPPVTNSSATLALIHHDDAAAATVAALEKGRADTAYNIVDDTPTTWRDFITTVATTFQTPRPLSMKGWMVRLAAPYAGRMMTEVSMNVSNSQAREQLGWIPRYPSCVEGIRAAAGTVNS